MIHRRRFLASGSLTIVALLASCASPEPVLYTLATSPGVPTQGSPAVGTPRNIVVREISLARYLDRPQVVRSAEDFQLALAQNDWWGEPLGRMVGRVMVADLSARLPASAVVAEVGAISALHADATVEVNILGFSPDRAGNVVLSAQIGVERSGRKSARVFRNFEFSTPMPTPDTKGQVAAMSVALGRLADATAELLR